MTQPGLKTVRLTAAFAIVGLAVATLLASKLVKNGGLSPYFFMSQDLAGLILACLVLLYLPAVEGLRGPFRRWVARLSLRPVATVAGLAVGAVLIGGLGWWVVFGGHALSDDEFMALFDSEIFRHGALIAPLPTRFRPIEMAMQPMFQIALKSGAGWSSSYYPVNAMILALLDVFGLRAAAGGLMSALSIVMVYRLAGRLWPDTRPAGLVAALLLASSSQLLVTAMTPYAMSAHLALNLLWLNLFLGRSWVSQGLALVVAAAATGLHQLVFHPLFAAPFVRDGLLKMLDAEPSGRDLILPQGSYKDIAYDADAGARVRAEFGLTDRDKLVISVGYADLRKGFDLFLQLWRHLQSPAGKRRGRVCLVWIGGIDPGLKDWLTNELADAEATGTFHMAGYRDDMDAVFSAADAFVLTSREDPFPTVVLEALSAGLPVVAFDRSGGIPDMLRETGQGDVVPYGDLIAMAAAVTAQLQAGITGRQRAERHALIADRFSFKAYVRKLLDVAMPGLPSVSVALPNYNYARHMPLRLGSIFAQSHPVHEVIVLDDASTDDSATVIPALAVSLNREIRFIQNETNSGSVFRQWRRAAELASGEFVWLAEADDASEPDFLTRALALLSGDPAIRFAFTDSRTIDADGAAQWASYKGYYATVVPGGLTQTEVFEAKEFVEGFLSVKNLILNVSSVVWRRDALLRALAACEADLAGFRMAGDWRLYLEALAEPGAKVAYEAEPLNVHRRHATSVTHALDADRHVQEIERCHAFARQAFALPEPVRARQTVYVAEVAEQLRAGAAKVGHGTTKAKNEPIVSIQKVKRKDGRRQIVPVKKAGR